MRTTLTTAIAAVALALGAAAAQAEKPASTTGPAATKAANDRAIYRCVNRRYFAFYYFSHEYRSRLDPALWYCERL